MKDILIIDDEKQILFSLQTFFEDEGFRVHCAASGEDGLEILQEKAIDLCVVDMRLPGIDGNEVIHLSRTLSPATKFLIHTGSSDYQLPHDLMQGGIDPQFVFRKPLPDMSILLHAVTRLLQ